MGSSATRAILLTMLLISSLFSVNSWGAVTASLSTSSLTFGSQTINTSSPIQTVILSNTGTSPLSLSSLVLGGVNPGQFTLNSTPNNTANSISYVSARVGQTNMYGMFGLNSDPTTDSSYTSLDYAWYSLPTGVLQIYESGVLVGAFGTYTTIDELSVVYEGSTIRYLKNGITQRSVATTAGRTFYLDTSLYNTGYTLNDIEYGVSIDTARLCLNFSANKTA
ncbi:MAG: hypothetical protein PHI11_11715 [Gallionella sp.]|nr:hypothetical protein [Gallionella sp.]